jgi:transposase
MYLCILDQESGKIVLHRNLRCEPQRFLRAIEPYRDNLVVGVECIFCWYWLADLCTQEGIPFVLGHALYMKAIHGGKAKNDKIDAHKIAVLLRGGMLPQAYVYPKRMRATRDLLRRRNHLMRKRADLLAHIQNTASQYNLPPLGTRVDRKGERETIPAHFPDPVVRRSIELDLSLISHYDGLLKTLEQELALMAKGHDAFAYHLLRSVPGVGRILSLVLLYEIEDVHRFPRSRSYSPMRDSSRSKRARPGRLRHAQAPRTLRRREVPDADLNHGGDREARRLTGELKGPSTNDDRRSKDPCVSNAPRSCAIRPFTRSD